MGESKRRKEFLGENYGKANINEQVKDAWEAINETLERAKQAGNDCIICQCCRDDKGFHPDAIEQVRTQIQDWNCPVDFPVLIQMLPAGVETSKTNMFEGFVTVWSNCPEYGFWKELFSIVESNSQK